MTATDPRPALAAMLLERLAPAAEALAAAYAQDANPEPPPPDDRARADYHRAGRAALAHLHKLLAVIDWSARHLPEPEPAFPDEAPHEAWDAEPVAEPAQPDYDGSEDEFHYGGESYVGSQETPEFRAWLEDLERRLGPVPLDDSLPDHLIDCTVGVRKFTGRLMTPEYRAWRDRQHRRAEASAARRPTSPEPRTTPVSRQNMTLHDIP